MSLREIAAGLVKASEVPAADEAPLEFEQASPVDVATDAVEASEAPVGETPESTDAAGTP